MNSFIAIEPKIDIESDLVVFLYYWRIISIPVPRYNRYRILNLFSNSSRASHSIRFSRLCALFFFLLYLLTISGSHRVRTSPLSSRCIYPSSFSVQMFKW